MSYNTRQLSPGGRRIVHQGRASDNAVHDPSYQQRHTAYTSPRSSTGVIPISTQTFVHVPPPGHTRPTDRHDPYAARPRRSSLVDTNRASGTTVHQLPGRTRASSPGKTGESRNVQHKKLYSIDDGAARLVADVNLPLSAGADRHHRRRDSDTERSSRRLSDATRDVGRKSYYANGHSRPVQATIDDEDAFSYTDPAGMYRDTEPRWREVRPRRGSLDRSGTTSRERPVSMLEPSDPRRSTRDLGPPVSTRGWDRINDGVSRTRSVRDAPRDVSQSPSRGRGYTDRGAYGDTRDVYHSSPRTSSRDRQVSMPYADRYDDFSYEEARSPRRHERRDSVPRGDRADRSVERRGFGIRGDSSNANRVPYGRSSDESFEQSKYRDSGYAEPHRHNSSVDYAHHDSKRLEQERRDRELAQYRAQNEQRERQWEREAREKDAARRRDEERAYDRNRDRDHDRPRDHVYDVDRERERERARQIDSPSDHERDRHHHRRDTDRDYDRKDHSPRQSSENVSQPSLARAATSGLAGVAAALGAKSLFSKVSGDKQDRERRTDSGPNGTEHDHERDSDRERRRERERERERERGLGFAYETPEGPPTQQDRSLPRDSGHQSATNSPVAMPAPAMDPNEEYRRRMEQVERELGGPSADQRTSDDDADRERRRREREQRQRSVDTRNGHHTDAGAYNNGSQDPFLSPTSARRNLDADNRSQVTTSSANSSTPSDLRKKPSILDRPLTKEPAEIIDNTLSEKRENRVRIVDPPTEEEDKKPKGILKKPTQKFPEDPNVVREGVAPLKDSTKKGIPPGARWTKIDRRLVNPEALEKKGERFEERLDCVIVLRVLTKEEIQKLADLTRELREQRYEDERSERKASRRHDRHHDRHDRDEYSDDSENEFKERAPLQLEAPPAPSSAASNATHSDSDHVRDNGRDRRRDRERDGDSGYNMSGGLGRRE